jgi:hypothetical protein
MVPRMAISSTLPSSGNGWQRALPAAATADITAAKAVADRRKVLLNMIPHTVWVDGDANAPARMIISQNNAIDPKRKSVPSSVGSDEPVSLQGADRQVGPLMKSAFLKPQ